MHFHALQADLVKAIAPSYYHPNALFYGIQHPAQHKQKEDVGLFSIKALNTDIAELGLLIFSEFRGKILTSKQCQVLLDFTQLQGFIYVIIGTYLTSMQKLCRRFKFDYLFTKNNKHWFMKELNT